jgi:sulfate adenylyltransferase
MMVSIPHGGRLVSRVSNDRERLLREACDLPSIEIGFDEALDVENIAYGVCSPLEGFMNYGEFSSVLEDMRLPSDIPWTIPIVLDVDGEAILSIREGDDVVLKYSGEPLAVMTVEEVYRFDRRLYAQRVFGTLDPNHPGVSKTLKMKEFLIGGPITLIRETPNPYEKYTLSPVETRVLFEERGWRTIAGFQTRNAPHLGHEYIQKSALVFTDGLFINPVIGRKKSGDFKDEVILAAYENLVGNYYPKNTVVLSILRYEMKYAGPREAIHHAIMRKNFGCTHFIVGRDHAGVGDYYKPYEAWDIFKEFPDLGITPLFVREFFYCRKCSGMANDKTCPHGEGHRVRFSGTEIRRMLLNGERPPPELMRPEVVDVILKFEKPFVED